MNHCRCGTVRYTRLKQNMGERTLVWQISELGNPIPDVCAVGTGSLALTRRIEDSDWKRLN